MVLLLLMSTRKPITVGCFGLWVKDRILCTRPSSRIRKSFCSRLSMNRPLSSVTVTGRMTSVYVVRMVGSVVCCGCGGCAGGWLCCPCGGEPAIDSKSPPAQTIAVARKMVVTALSSFYRDPPIAIPALLHRHHIHRETGVHRGQTLHRLERTRWRPHGVEEFPSHLPHLVRYAR